MIEPGFDVGVSEGAFVGAEMDAEAPAPFGPGLGIWLAFDACKGGMSEETNHFVARETSERQLQQQIDGLGDTAFSGEPAINDIDRYVMVVTEDAFDLREVLVADALRYHDRDLMEAQWRAGVRVRHAPDHRPDCIGSDFKFAADAGAFDEADAAVARRR